MKKFNVTFSIRKTYEFEIEVINESYVYDIIDRIDTDNCNFISDECCSTNIISIKEVFDEN